MGFMSQFIASVAGGAIGGSFVLWGVNLQSQRQGEAACRALLVEVGANLRALKEMNGRQPVDSWSMGKPNPGWLTQSVWKSQLPYIVQRIGQETLRLLVEAYGTFDALPDMRALRPSDSSTRYAVGGWIEEHLKRMETAFSPAEEQLRLVVDGFKPVGESVRPQTESAVTGLRRLFERGLRVARLCLKGFKSGGQI